MRCSSSFLVLLLFVSVGSSLFAQNKTLGVGTTTPNANAALHVEAPAGNQGFIMPRLTTAQRTAGGFQGILSTADAGLMVYDTDLKSIQIWDGTDWKSAAKLPVPYVDTVTSLATGSNIFRLVNNNTGAGNFGVAHFENLNPESGFSAIFGRTNSATNGVADFIVNNTANNNDALGVVSNGIGKGGSFTINNTSSFSYAVFGQSNGDSTSAAVHGSNVGNGFGVYGKSAGSKFASAAVYGEHVGTGDAAGAFRISNSSNPYSGLYGETNGSGAAIFANNIGTGRGLQAQINNAANTQAAIRGFTNGLGNAGFLTVSNVANDSSALYVVTTGTGPAIKAEGDIVAKKFVGDGSLLTNVTSAPFSFPYATSLSDAGILFDITNTNGAAGKFSISNGSSAGYALLGETNGALLGAAVYGNNTGSGFGVYGKANGPAQGSAAVYGEQTGAGDAAGAFRIKNTASGMYALYGETNGTGAGNAAVSGLNIGSGNGAYFRKNGSNAGTAALWADNFGSDGYGAIIQNAGTSPLPALYAESAGSGQSILTAKTGIETGHAIEANHSGTNGHAGYFYVSATNAGGSGVYARVDGDGTAVSALNTSNGYAGSFETTNAANTNPALLVSSASTSAPALTVSQTGGSTGLSINVSGGQAAELYSDNSSQAFYVANTGTGRAGQFTGSGTGNPTLQAQNGGAGGTALALFQTNAGYALDVQSGAIRNSVVTYSANDTMTDKAAIYSITTLGGTYILSAAGRLDGETIILTTDVGGGVTIDLGGGFFVDILQGEAVTAVFANGSWRAPGVYQP